MEEFTTRDALAQAEKDKTRIVFISDGPLLTEEEENVLTAERTVTEETVLRQAKRMFEENAPAAAKTIILIAKHGAGERNRLSAAQYIIERVLGRTQDNPPKLEDNPYDRLVDACVKFVGNGEAITTDEAVYTEGIQPSEGDN